MKSGSKKYLIYQTTNLINGKIYVGRHIGKINDGYLGSGTRLLKAINKYGRQNFRIDVVFELPNLQLLREKEAEIINEKFLTRANVYNLALGGPGSWEQIDPVSKELKNVQEFMIHTIDKNGKYFYIHKTDERYLLGELVSAKRGTHLYKDKNGKIFCIKTTDPRVKNLGLISLNKNTVMVRFKDGSTGRISCDDPRLFTKEAVHINKGMVTVIDKEGKSSIVSRNNPLYVSGELKHITTGKVVAKNSAGKRFKVNKNDPLILNGTLVSHTTGYIRIHNNKENKFVSKENLTKYLEQGFVLGMLPETKSRKKETKPRNYKIKICPYCNFTFINNAGIRYHFNNCKRKPT